MSAFMYTLAAASDSSGEGRVCTFTIKSPIGNRRAAHRDHANAQWCVNPVQSCAILCTPPL